MVVFAHARMLAQKPELPMAKERLNQLYCGRLLWPALVVWSVADGGRSCLASSSSLPPVAPSVGWPGRGGLGTSGQTLRLEMRPCETMQGVEGGLEWQAKW